MDWVSLKERLPNEDENYIVSLESGWVGIDTFDVRRKEWFEHQYRVVAWMPLPEPYKEVLE